MSRARHLHYTYGEYLEALAISEIRFDYLDGEISRWPVVRQSTE